MNPYLTKNIDQLIKRVERKKASLIIIDGGVGEGKTTLAVKVADYIQGGEIDFKSQYAIGGEQFQEKLIICQEKGLKVVIYDEAGDFNTRGALTKFNGQLNRLFETFRAFRVIVILVLPSFKVVDNSILLKQIPRLLLHLYGRTRTKGYFNGYSLGKMFFIKTGLDKLPLPSYAYSSQTPNFRGSFDDLAPARSKELEKISLDGKKEIINKNILNSKGLFSVEEISKKLGKSKAWVWTKTRELKIKPVKKYKKSNFYDEVAFKSIEEAVL